VRLEPGGPDGLKDAENGQKPRRRIGFPVGDMFLVDAELDIAEGDKPDWSELVPYKCNMSDNPIVKLAPGP
jgi:hypothetical protein